MFSFCIAVQSVSTHGEKKKKVLLFGAKASNENKLRSYLLSTAASRRDEKIRKAADLH